MVESQTGIVDDVTIDQDRRHVYVTVMTAPEVWHHGIPFESPMAGVWMVPSEGDVVEVHKSNTGYVARGCYSRAPAAMPSSLSEGDIAISLNDNTTLHLNNTGDGYDLNIDIDGDLLINGDAVATESHTHDYTWSDSGGSGTTDPANDDGLTK